MTRTAKARTALAGVLAGALTAAALAHGAAQSRTPAHPLALGFMDNEITQFAAPSDTALELARAKRAGATVWGLGIAWSAISPSQPPSLAAARDPNWSGYDWTATDAAVRAIGAAGLQTLAVLSGAPAWAEGPGRPSFAVAPAGAWEPSKSWFGAFATALLSRYSGSFTDPLGGGDLPAIRDWEPWNEPNLSLFLAPQWKRVGGKLVEASPGIYRNLLDAFYAAKQAVAPHDLVAAGATAPFGDPPGGARIPPVEFWRALLCVHAGARPQPSHCSAHDDFDAISHHPYPVGPPTFHAVNADDASVPDLAKITRLLAAAEQAGTVSPAGPKPLWITEISWDTHPDPKGLPFATQARYLQGAIDVLYHEGASLFLWYNLRDEPLPSPALINQQTGLGLQSGVYTRGATPAEDVAKPSLTAFAFPFTAYRNNGVAQLWGMAPAAGTVTIQEQRGTNWVTVAHLHASSTRIFSGTLVAGPRTNLRAVAGARRSLTWRTS